MLGARPLDSDLIELRHCHLADGGLRELHGLGDRRFCSKHVHVPKFMLPEISLGFARDVRDTNGIMRLC
jgi:hypothetical protein